MNNFKLSTYLSSHLGAAISEISPLVETCILQDVEKDEFLLRENEHCKHTFFVENGLIRQYAIDEKGKEHTISFAPENWFVSDRESTYFDTASSYYIQALENSKVLLLDERFFTLLSEKVPSYPEFNNKLLHNNIRHMQNRIRMLLSASAQERYLEFIEMYPDILQRVPQTMVASYLGITPESLSRVRKELMRKSFGK